MTNTEDFVVYPAIFEYADDGITITFPDLQGCISCANTQEDAVRMAEDALGVWYSANIMKDDIPKPSNIKDIKIESNQCICLIHVWIPIYTQMMHSGSVKKSVTVPVWLNELAERQELNFSQILQAGLKSAILKNYRGD